MKATEFLKESYLKGKKYNDSLESAIKTMTEENVLSIVEEIRKQGEEVLEMEEKRPSHMPLFTLLHQVWYGVKMGILVEKIKANEQIYNIQYKRLLYKAINSRY